MEQTKKETPSGGGFPGFCKGLIYVLICLGLISGMVMFAKKNKARASNESIQQSMGSSGQTATTASMPCPNDGSQTESLGQHRAKAGEVTRWIPIMGYTLDIWPSTAKIDCEFQDANGKITPGVSAGVAGTTDTKDLREFVRLKPVEDILYSVRKN